MYLKVEGMNPTGSFKDRGMTAAISVARHEGAQAVVCASTGNTSASMSAYAARAGLTPIVLMPEGKIAVGKVLQALVAGALLIGLAQRAAAILIGLGLAGGRRVDRAIGRA